MKYKKEDPPIQIDRDLQWLCENSKDLEKYSGRCIVFNVNEGLVSSGEADEVLKLVKKNKKSKKPFIFHVPEKSDFSFPEI